MEWNNKNIFLSDQDLTRLSIFLAYGIGLGVLVGLFLDNIPFYFSLGGVISIISSLITSMVLNISKDKKLD